jgi:hypothetical protein
MMAAVAQGAQFCPRVVQALEDIRRNQPQLSETQASGRLNLVAVANVA